MIWLILEAVKDPEGWAIRQDKAGEIHLAPVDDLKAANRRVIERQLVK